MVNATENTHLYIVHTHDVTTVIHVLLQILVLSKHHNQLFSKIVDNRLREYHLLLELK